MREAGGGGPKGRGTRGGAKGGVWQHKMGGMSEGREDQEQGAGLTREVRSCDVVLASVSVEIGSSLRADTNSEADPALHLQAMPCLTTTTNSMHKFPGK